MPKKIYDVEKHFLTVDFARGLGLAQDGNVEFFHPEETEWKNTSLRPLLVCSLSVPAYSHFYRQLVDPLNPISLSLFLSKAWGERRSIGVPLALEIKSSLSKADQGFCAWVSSLSIIQVIVSDSVRSITAFERSASNVAHGASWQLKGRHSLAASNDALIEYDVFTAAFGNRTSMEELNYRTWVARDPLFCTKTPLPSDWDPSLIKLREAARPAPELRYDDDEACDYYVEDVASVAAMWPSGRKSLLAQIGLSAQHFNWWAAGQSSIPYDVFDRLCTILNIYNNDGVWEHGGGYLLVATTSTHAKKAYDAISHGGDLLMAFEICGPSGEYGSQRVLFLEAHGGLPTIILFKRDGGVEKLLDSKRLINLSKPANAPEAVWSHIESLMNNSNLSSSSNRVGKVFSDKFGEWLKMQADRAYADLHFHYY